MQPSSLIFLVIIGIWAAYFVQYWVRRREHLATIRSVDAFSETMRVLQRRAPLPSVDAGSQAPRTYAVSPARAMRPQVTVKRAEASVAQRAAGAAPAFSSSSASSSGSATIPATAARRSAPDLPHRHDAEPEVATMRPSRAMRGIVLLVGLLGTVVFGVLAAVGILMAWAPLIPLTMAAAGFGWLRAGIQGEIRARHEARSAARSRMRPAAPRSQGRPSHRRPVPAERGSTSTDATQVRAETEAEAEAEVAERGPVEHRSESDREAPAGIGSEVAADAPYDVAAPTGAATAAPEPAAAAAPAAALAEVAPIADQPVADVAIPDVDEDDIPLTWDPRPVPRPTYTMKARAPERSAPATPVEAVSEGERTAYDELPQRRISGL